MRTIRSVAARHARAGVRCRTTLTLAFALLAACWTSKPAATPEPIGNAAPPPAPAPNSETPPPDDTKLRVTGMDPAVGDALGGTYVLVKGRRFLADGPRNVKVYFGSHQGTVVRFQSDTELIVQAPGGKPNETVDVLLVFDPGGQIKLPQSFTFVDKQP